MNVKKVKEKLSRPWVAVNLLLLIVFLAMVTVHIKVEPVNLDELLSIGNDVDSKNLCDSPECITLSHELLNYQDPSVDPCVDFFQHSCGRFHEQSVSESRLQKKKHILRKQIREFLHKIQNSTSKSENLMKLVFDKCEASKKTSNDNYKISRDAIHDVFNDIKKIGAWPLLDKNWDGSKFDLNEMLSNLVKLGATNLGLFQLDFRILTEGKFVRIAPTLGSIVHNSTMISMISEILEANGVQPDSEEISKEFEEYSSLQMKLAKYQSSGKLSISLPGVRSINFSSLITEMIHPSRVSKIFGKIRVVTSEHPLFFKSNETESDVRREFPRASLRVFMRNFVDKGNRDGVKKLTEELKKNTLEMIQDTENLAPPVKESMLKKVEAIKVTIGYPDHFDPPGTLDKEFENFDLDSTDSYYRIFQKLNRLRSEQQMEFIAGETPISPIKEVLKVNANYKRSKNALTVFAPFLDDPFFDITYPDYVNLFFSGFLIAHEIGHSVDANGLGYDENGKPMDGIRLEHVTEYGKQGQCLVDQYDNYDDPVYGKKMNGTHSINEIIADWVGHEVTWRAYKKMDTSKMLSLIGLKDINMDQLYFRVQSLLFCRERDTISLEETLKDVYPTDNFRVNGAYARVCGGVQLSGYITYESGEEV
ncbi:Peptidase_M13 domain-containing protein [Caenorhabditis elegans]|uniref:Peptidase_M13 domain-containing protein n=2 Tax=Caenorhabditis elegans TaxID=6239 RepID=A0A131MBF3_CAEEL|nr:Peptidase_M13 domain-containing protein [Caenorhabditis elegans]CZR14464.1 Peptidase_M13 domain-containing protein [Caenorhabditis elegans]|eukprot:NP_001309549.1 NEPrilysin metallopeptidase family [Caenorhabditis elegans]